MSSFSYKTSATRSSESLFYTAFMLLTSANNVLKGGFGTVCMLLTSANSMVKGGFGTVCMLLTSANSMVKGGFGTVCIPRTSANRILMGRFGTEIRIGTDKLNSGMKMPYSITYIVKTEVLPIENGTPAKNNVPEFNEAPSNISVTDLVRSIKIHNYDTKVDDNYGKYDLKFSLYGTKW